MQGGSNVPFQQNPFRPRQTLNPSKQVVRMVVMGTLYQMGGYPYLSQPYPGSYPYPPNQYMGGPYGSFSLNTMSPLNQNPFENTQLPFFTTLELLDLSKLKNYPIMPHPAWPLVPVKIPIDIPKFEGKTGDDLTSHITTYHLWCVSNSMLNDSIMLHLFH